MSRAFQVCKIREIGEALISAGVVTLDEQAEVLGLCRSTTWSLIQASHKTSGLSASVINTMLEPPRLPPGVRTKVLEYVEEKISGHYGHGARQISRFAGQLNLSKSVLRPKSLASRLKVAAPGDRAMVKSAPAIATSPKAMPQQ